MVQTRQSQKRLHNASSKVCTSWSGPMPGSDKSASGTSGICHHSRRGAAIRVAGTEDHLITPDSENTSEPSEQVNRPHDLPELKKWRQWSHNQNKEVIYCYNMAIKDKSREYQKRMHQQWKDRGNIECPEQWLCDQKKQIEDKTLLTPAEIEEVKQQVKKSHSPRGRWPTIWRKTTGNNYHPGTCRTWSHPWIRTPNTDNLSWNTRW